MRGSIHIHAKYSSNKGESIENGYSSVMELSGRGYNRAFTYALWNGAYKHASSVGQHGSDYTYNYKLLNVTVSYFETTKVKGKKKYITRDVTSNEIDTKKLKEEFDKKQIEREQFNRDKAITREQQQNELYPITNKYMRSSKVETKTELREKTKEELINEIIKLQKKNKK
jgi:hypothetical protein